MTFSVHEIGSDEVLARLASGESLTLLDVRQPWEYERRRLPGALLLPLGRLASEHAAALDSDAEVICVCEHGVRSLSAARFLAAQGYANVATMTDGMSAYVGPTEDGPESRDQKP